MKSGILVLIALIALEQQGYAQRLDDVINPRMQNEDIWKASDKVVGHPFFNDEWMRGEVTTQNGGVFRDILLKYNVEKGQVYLRQEDGEVQILSTNKVRKFKLQSLLGEEYSFVRTGFEGYSMMLYDGEVKLFKKYSKWIKEGQTSNGYNSSATRDSYQEKVSLFFYKDDKMHEFENKKEFLAFWDDSKVLQFIKKEKIKYSREDDVIRALKFAEGLN